MTFAQVRKTVAIQRLANINRLSEDRSTANAYYKGTQYKVQYNSTDGIQRTEQRVRAFPPVAVAHSMNEHIVRPR